MVANDSSVQEESVDLWSALIPKDAMDLDADLLEKVTLAQRVGMGSIQTANFMQAAP